MWWWAAAFAVAPEGVDPEDLGRWEQGSQALLAGPPGCWDFAGKLAITGVSYTPASRWSRSGRADHAFVGSFAGRLADGVWSTFAYDLTRADNLTEPAEIDLMVRPAMGRMPDGVARRTNPSEEESEVALDGGTGEAADLLDEILDGLEPATATAYAEWRDPDASLHLFQDVPVSKEPRADTVSIVTRFPGGGPATAIDATFPKRLRVGEGLVKVTVFDGQLHLRGQPSPHGVLPAAESLSLGAGALGFTVGYEQKLTFLTATRCP